jgi:hypothetical protein
VFLFLYLKFVSLLPFSQFIFLVVLILFVPFLILVFAQLDEFLCPCCAVVQVAPFMLSKTRTFRLFLFCSRFSLQRETRGHHVKPKALFKS